MRVLVIDDADSARCAVAQGLRAAGVEVLEAADGPVGLAKALDGGVDLVVLDLRLPGMDGEAVLATLRRSSAVPVIVVSSKRHEDDRVGVLDLGADVIAQDSMDGRTALMGAAHKGSNAVIEMLVQHGADLALRDIGSRDTINALAGVRFQPIDYADGLVRIGVQSAIAHPDTFALLKKLMKDRNLPVPKAGRTLESICVVDLCK